MKTPTLIVRLTGLYLMVHSALTLIQVRRMNALMGGVANAQEQLVGDLGTYAVIGLVVGVAATIFAGALARVMTFDAGRE